MKHETADQFYSLPTDNAILKNEIMNPFKMLN